jgi:hypothetical protein
MFSCGWTRARQGFPRRCVRDVSLRITRCISALPVCGRCKSRPYWASVKTRTPLTAHGCGIFARKTFSILPIQLEHVWGLDALPRLHGDPFDRMLISQARYEGLTLVTADELIRQYYVEVLWT